MAWTLLPEEMKLAVVECVGAEQDVRALGATSRAAHSLCIPMAYKRVHIRGSSKLHQFHQSVPAKRGRHVHELRITILDEPLRTIDVLRDVLSWCSDGMKTLSLELHGSPPNAGELVGTFAKFTSLQSLSIRNTAFCADEHAPLSERLVTALALAVSSTLHTLSLQRITRSAIHTDLEAGCLPLDTPLVANDDDILPHPTLGAQLSLPSLLELPHLKNLTLLETSLGDPRWASANMVSPLEHLHVGDEYADMLLLRCCNGQVKTLCLDSAPEMPWCGSEILDSVTFGAMFPMHLLPENLAAAQAKCIVVQSFEEDMGDLRDLLESHGLDGRIQEIKMVPSIF